MKGTIQFFIISAVAFSVLFIACSPKGEDVRPVSKDEPFSCANCIVQGSLYDGETLEPLAFKEVALYAKKWGGLKQQMIRTSLPMKMVFSGYST